MDIWISVQLTILFIWLIAAFFFYRYKAWKVGSPLTSGNMLFLVLRFFMLAGLLSSIILGVIYVISTIPNVEYLPVITMLVLPILLIIIFGVKYYMVNNEISTRDGNIKLKTEQIKAWVQKFPFINNEMIEIKIYISNGRATGRLIVKKINKDQAEVIKHHENELPNDIHLVVFHNNQEDNSSGPYH